MKPLIVFTTAPSPLLVSVLLACFTLAQVARAKPPTSEDRGNGNSAAENVDALNLGTTGSDNTAHGWFSLFSNTSANNNTADGFQALFSNTGSNNTCIGSGAGSSLDVGDNNICVGAGVTGFSGESSTIRIADNAPQIGGTTSKVFIGGIFGMNVGVAVVPVLINANGQLGTVASSARFKKDIDPMGKTSEAIFSLRPVTFHYKGDETNLPCFGLIAEEVAKVNPDLILLDKEGKPQTVRYEQINAMLLNEFLKEHKIVEQQQATIAELRSMVAQQRKDFEAAATKQQEQIQALAVGLQEVSVRLAAGSPRGRTSGSLEMSEVVKGRLQQSRPTRRIAVNNP